MRCIAGLLPPVLAAGTLVASGCSSLTSPDGLETQVVARLQSRPAWSGDGHTIYYTDRLNGGITEVSLHALDVASGGARRLAAVNALNHGEQVRTTEDPSVVFVSIAHPDWSSQLDLYRVPAAGGTPERLRSNLGSLWFVLSGDGERVAYQGSSASVDADTIYVASTSQPAQQVTLPSAGRFPRVMSLSPSGDFLVYGSWAGVHLAPTTGSDSHRLIVAPSAGPRAIAPDIMWVGDAPHLLVSEAPTALEDSIVVEDLDAVSGERTVLGAVPRGLAPEVGWELARSRDGSAFAAWIPVELVQETFEGPIYRYRLYLKRQSDPRALRGLELIAGSPLWFEFSPDGSRIALLLGGKLYLVTTG
jgi:hypothetical protein